MQQLISATGYGVRTAHRILRMRRFQKKQSDGLTPDDTDTAARASELFKDALEDIDVLAHRGLGQESITTGGVEVVDVKLPDFQREFQSMGLILSELANVGGSIYGIKPTKQAYMRTRGSADSGFLISNHLESGDDFYLLTQNYDQNKLLISRNKAITYKDSTIGFGFTHVHGVGGQSDSLDVEQLSANAVFDLNTNHLAIPITPTKSNISKVALFLSKVGTVDKDLTVSIIGRDGSSLPNVNDTRRKVIVPSTRLNAEVTTGGIFFEIGFEKLEITVREQLFILIHKYADAGELRIDYQTGAGTYYTDADLNPPWTSNVGNMKIRTYTSKTMHIIATNTVVAKQSKRNKEMVFSLVDFPNELFATRAMESITDVYGKKKRIYSPITVSTPTTFFDLGKTARLLDKFTGLDQKVDIVGYHIESGADLGAADMVIFVEDLHL